MPEKDDLIERFEGRLKEQRVTLVLIVGEELPDDVRDWPGGVTTLMIHVPGIGHLREALEVVIDKEWRAGETGSTKPI